MMKREIRLEFKIDGEKADKITHRLLDLFYGKKGFFEGYSMPEYILPRNLEKGSRDHALYLTYVISVDYMTDAEKLWARSRSAHELYPERFKPEEIKRLSDQTLRSFIKGIGARFPSNGVSIWRKISKTLLEQFNGDPRNITPTPLSIEEVKNRLDKFPSLRGPKLSNFYIRAMGENNLFKMTNFDQLDIPVDKQVARFTMYTGVLKLLSEQFQGCVHEPPLRGLIEEAWRDAAKKLGTPPWKLDEPIWTIGSKLCSGRKCGKCPVEELCDKTKGITFKENTAIWRKQD